MAKAPEKRNASCIEFASALRDSLGTTAFHLGPVTSVPEVRTPTEINSNPGGTPPGSAGSETVSGYYSDAPPPRDFAVTVTAPVPGPEPDAELASNPGTADNASRPEKAGLQRTHRNLRVIVTMVSAVVVIAVAAFIVAQNLSQRQRRDRPGGRRGM